VANQNILVNHLFQMKHGYVRYITSATNKVLLQNQKIKRHTVKNFMKCSPYSPIRHREQEIVRIGQCVAHRLQATTTLDQKW